MYVHMFYILYTYTYIYTYIHIRTHQRLLHSLPRLYACGLVTHVRKNFFSIERLQVWEEQEDSVVVRPLSCILLRPCRSYQLRDLPPEFLANLQ